MEICSVIIKYILIRPIVVARRGNLNNNILCYASHC